MDKTLWLNNKDIFKEENIQRISFYSMKDQKNIELLNNEKNSFIYSLKSSKFYKSNWEGEMNGGLPVEVTFIYGSKFFLQYFGDCVFQINYKERPFSIYNENLEMMLIKNGANQVP